MLAVNLFGQSRNKTLLQDNQLMRLAQSFEKAAQFNRALEIYQQLWEKRPSDINYYRGVKNNQLKLNRYSDAIFTVKKMLTINSSAIIEVDLGDIYYKMGNEEQALQAWDGVLKKFPQKQTTYQVVANAMNRNFLYDKAMSVYKQGQSVLKNNKIFLIEMANLYRSQRDYQNAVQLYLNYLENYPKQYTFIEYNITSFLGDRDFVEKIEKILLNRISKSKNNIQFRNILAAVYIRSSNYRAALEEYSTIDEYILTRPKSERGKLGRELFNFANNAFNDGEYQYAIQAFQLVFTRYPKSPHAPQSRIGIARSYERLNDFEKSIETYREVIRDYANSVYAKNSHFNIGNILFQKYGNYKEAEKSFKAVLATGSFNAKNFEAMFRIGDCYLMEGELDQASSWYDQIQRQKKLTHDLKMKVLFKIAQTLFWKGEFEKASEQFFKVQTAHVNILNEKEGMLVNDALEYQLLIEDGKKAPEVLTELAKAKLLMEQKKNKAALKALKKMIDQDLSPSLMDDILLLVGQLNSQLGNYEASLAAFNKVVQEFPQSVWVDLAQKQIGDIYDEGLTDTANALLAYELILTKYPDSIYLEEVRRKIRELEEK